LAPDGAGEPHLVIGRIRYRLELYFAYAFKNHYTFTMSVIQNRFYNLSSHVSYIGSSTNIGIIAFEDNNGSKIIYMIESGNDAEQAKEILDCTKEKFPEYTLKTVLNTHSHADHCGGNNYLKSQTGCHIWCSKGEAALMAYPELESSLIWGGTPIHQIRSTYLMAESCQADCTFTAGDILKIETSQGTILIEAVPLPGHYLDQTGFLITDTDGKKSLFMGDAISGRNVIRKYWIQYLYNETNTKKSLEKLAKIEADFYIPGHGHLVDNIEGLSELNLIAILETEDMILDVLKTPKTNDEILKAVADRNSIQLGLTNYVLIGSTLRSYLSGLYEEGKITFEITDNMLYWKKSE